MINLLGKMVKALVREYRPQKIILFGSHVWGEPDLDSDIDLFIIKATDEPFFKRLATVRKIISPFRKGLPLDVIVLTPEEFEAQLRSKDPFVVKIAREGKVLYDEASR